MSEVCPGCGQPIEDDASIIQTPPPAQVVWHARCHDRCLTTMNKMIDKMHKRQKIRAWRPGEREALEKDGKFSVVRAENRGGMSVGAQVELDDAEDLARTMPEAFGR